MAHQLAARGWRTTVIERFHERRNAGQNVDIRGAAREVIRRMGIDAEVRAANTTEVGMRFLRADGSTAAAFPVSPGTDGPTAELEILRGELSRILIERTATTEYRFGTQIVDATDHGDHVAVALDDGSTRDADLLVIAEGLRSRSRRFVSDAGVKDLGMYFAYATVPRRDDDDKWWNWQSATESRAVHLRPDNLGTTRAILTFISDVRGLEDLAPQDQIAILRRNFDDLGDTATRILDALEAGAPMYFSVVGQTRSASWSKGRIALLGDAAHCNATFGGAGTSMALLGAYILAGEAGAGGDIPAALHRYQQVMAPFVDAVPLVRPGALRLVNPRTRAGIRALHAAARMAAGPMGRAANAAVAAAGKLPIMHAAGNPSLPTYL
jgi:2-polyprenyl-6-methoxyphenol hydroxylase-like FAD-dependent oxidoreductase